MEFASIHASIQLYTGPQNSSKIFEINEMGAKETER